MASLQELEAAEDATRSAVARALDQYLTVVEARVFKDPGQPNWSAWPSELWPELYARNVLPVLADEFEQQLRAEGVTDESVIRGATATFITQVSFLVDDPRVPARVLEEATQAVASEEFPVAGPALIATLLVVGAVVWAGVVGVAASNAAALAINSAVNTAGQVSVDRGRTVFKTWRAVDDPHTRMSHAAVDDVRVPFGGVFSVGGFPLRFPHDPFGPPQEIMNCRCVLSVEVA